MDEKLTAFLELEAAIDPAECQKTLEGMK